MFIRIFSYLAAASCLLYQTIRVYIYIYLCSPILDSVTATARGANYLTVFPMKDTLCDQCVGPTEFMLAKVVRRSRAYGLSFLSERTIKSNHFTKAALSPQLFKDPECWSGRGKNQRLLALQTVLTQLS